MSVKEILNEVTISDVSWGGIVPGERKFIIYGNTEDEILELFADFFNQDDSLEETELQKKFRALRLTQGRRNIDDPKMFCAREKESQSLVVHKYRFAVQLVGSCGTIADSFLKRNWEHSSRDVT